MEVLLLIFLLLTGIDPTATSGSTTTGSTPTTPPTTDGTDTVRKQPIG